MFFLLLMVLILRCGACFVGVVPCEFAFYEKIISRVRRCGFYLSPYFGSPSVPVNPLSSSAILIPLSVIRYVRFISFCGRPWKVQRLINHSAYRKLYFPSGFFISSASVISWIVNAPSPIREWIIQSIFSQSSYE